jgi:phosphoribosylformylglycinamidine cyclo-ligase
VSQGASYAAAGVDIEAGDRAVELMKEWVSKATRPEVVGGLGGFAGLFDASALTAYRRPLLATSTDGVGTKVAIAQKLDRHDTIGFDLVGLVVCGAEPLFMTDYICTGKVVPETIAQIVKGIAEACVEAGTALVGGETAEHPGLLEVGEYDVAGASTGVVEADELLGAERVKAGDVVVAMASSGLHSNGYSLVRHVFFDRAGWQLDREVPELGGTLGDTLITPTRVYAKHCLELIRALNTGGDRPLHAMSHITGGGFAANLARVIPDELAVRIDRSTWTPAPVFGLVGQLGDVPQLELEKTLNMGVGMVAVLDPAAADRAIAVLAERDIPAWVCGEVSIGTAGVELQGDYAS